MFCSEASHRVQRNGFYPRSTGRSPRIQRFHCCDCQRSFSTQSSAPFRRERKSHINQRLLRLLTAGVSQRRAAILLNVSRTTVARKIRRLGLVARLKNAKENWRLLTGSQTITFDEMESFEHTKCKPLSIAVAVDKATRRIIATRVSKMPANGRLAEVSRRKYGHRPDHRSRGLHRVLRAANYYAPATTTLRSDECPRYPRVVRQHFPGSQHETYKGRPARSIGLGELKIGGFDPLFAVNHSAAMVRDNLKRLTRKTWCTTKDPSKLQDLLDIYTWHHNQVVKKGWHRVRI